MAAVAFAAGKAPLERYLQARYPTATHDVRPGPEDEEPEAASPDVLEAPDVDEGATDTPATAPATRESLEPIIQEAAATHGVDADLLRAVIQTESNFNSLAQSHVGAQGLMQLMPRTARDLGVEDPFNARDNVFGGAKYLSRLIDRFKGNVPLALAGYNAGPAKVARHGGVPPFSETTGYVRKIGNILRETDSAFASRFSWETRSLRVQTKASRTHKVKPDARKTNVRKVSAAKPRRIRA